MDRNSPYTNYFAINPIQLLQLRNQQRTNYKKICKKLLTSSQKHNNYTPHHNHFKSITKMTKQNKIYREVQQNQRKNRISKEH